MTSNTPAGYAGRILRVDLTTETVTAEPLSDATLRQCIGGTGLGAKYLYEEVSPGVAWDDPQNRVILAPGPLAGTRVNGSGTYCVVTKGALTEGGTSTQANGYFGAYMRFSGFDGIIVQGAAKRWLYLYVHDGTAELRDAGHLVGKNTWDTEDAVKDELGQPGRAMSVACIGPAGENKVRFAVIENDHGHVAAHNGPGAVLGSKKLKAIAISRGKGKMNVHDPARLTSLAKELSEMMINHPIWGNFHREGTLWTYTFSGGMGFLPVKNYTTNLGGPDEETLKTYTCDSIRTRFNAKRNPCWACQNHHCGVLTVPEGPDAGKQVDEPEYEGLAAMGSIIGNTDVVSTIVLANEVDLLGVDTNEAGWLVGFAMECYEKGILNKADLGGLDLRWANFEATRALLGMIARRQGIGDVLADGVMRAARRIGGDAPNMAIHTMKGVTPRGHDHRTMALNEMFDGCVSSTGTLEGGNSLQAEEEQALGFVGRLNPMDPGAVRELPHRNVKGKFYKPFEDSLGTCMFTAHGTTDQLCALLSAATGWEFLREEAIAMGSRTINLMKAFDLRHGHSRAEDRPSPRYGSTPVDGPLKGFNPVANWDQMLDNYYEGMGWDKATGKPLPETLRSLGLEQVAADLWP